MDTYQIPRSRNPIIAQIISGGIITLLACILVTMFFNRIVTVAPSLQTIFITALWCIVPLLWLLGSYITLTKWPKTSHILTRDALIVRKKGWFGASSEQLYRYDTILTVGTSKSPFGDFGTITITMSRLDPIVIRFAESPLRQAEKVKGFVAKSQPITQNLGK